MAPIWGDRLQCLMALILEGNGFAEYWAMERILAASSGLPMDLGPMVEKMRS